MLAPSGHPHPTLHGTLGELASVIANNLRVLAAPFLLAVFHWPAGRITRRLGDVLIAALIAQNTLAVGLALGRWGDRLLPYVPQLPLEWTALGIAGAAWLTARDGSRPPRPRRLRTRHARADDLGRSRRSGTHAARAHRPTS